jgi:hypothetical protein
MRNFPVVIVDNFFKEPDKVRNFALHQEFKKDKKISNYPGLRTDCLSVIEPNLHNEFLRKFFSIYYDFKFEEINWVAHAVFQKTDNSFDNGWIHYDNDGNANNKVAGIVYLTPNAPLNSGTSIYKTKNNVLIPSINAEAKNTHYYANGNSEELKKLKDLEKTQFDETINVSNIYNRLISFDADEYHAAQNYFGQDNESRLILVFFVKKFDAYSTPLERSHSNKV